MGLIDSFFNLKNESGKVK